MNAGKNEPVRLAMWSGPRNISTAMMRSFGNRVDTLVVDEPLYASYLAMTGIDHPGRDEVLAAGPTDWREAVEKLLSPVPDGKAIFYQKHMAHHLLPEMDTDWIDSLTNCFLIRDPREMMTSFIKVIPNPTAAQLGLPQQLKLFERERERTGQVPAVIDSRDVLENPRGMLGALCRRVGIDFDPAMLNWPAGSRSTDGVWARYWYANVERSTGFGQYKPKAEQVPSELLAVYEECQACYELLAAHRIRA